MTSVENKVATKNAHFEAPETGYGKERNIDLKEKTDQIIQSILSEELPTVSQLPLMNKPEANQVGATILRVIYPKLVERHQKVDSDQCKELLDSKREFARNFVDLTKETNLGCQWSREKGKTTFHFGNKLGEKSINDGFAYYFNKSQSQWRPYNGDVKRAYLTIKPELVREIPKHFVGLVDFLFQSGIDFYAKAGSPWHASRRTDDFVFYISPNDVGRTHELFRDYIGDKKIFEGSVLSATPDEQIDGLSWGEEPSSEETNAWQKVTNDRGGVSYSQSLALKMAPAVFNSIASEYHQRGNEAGWKDFRALASQTET